MKPPGHTCPQIDRAQSALRKLAWRCANPEHRGVTPAEVMAEGHAALEQVREENRQMRAAYWDMHKRLTAAGFSVTETPVAPVRSEERASSPLCSRCGHSLRLHTMVRMASGLADPDEYTDCLECGADQGICMPYTKYSRAT